MTLPPLHTPWITPSATNDDVTGGKMTLSIPPNIPVETAQGHTVVTLMLYLDSSLRSDSDKPKDPNLLRRSSDIVSMFKKVEISWRDEE